jgi:hypothetical protein
MDPRVGRLDLRGKMNSGASKGAGSVERFDFEACLRVSEFRFTRGSALYRE